MKKIPYKVRVGISVGLFSWSICAVIASIVFSQQGLLWTAYVGPILAAIAFIASIIIMPKTKEDGSPIVGEKKPKPKKIKNYKLKKQKKPFISDKEWDELDEEDEEEMYILED